MLQVLLITFKGIFRDRVFRGIAISTIFFLLIPAISPLSMRQVAQLSITLSLSLTSFILLLLSVFLGASSLWKDLERRYSYSVLSLPLPRTSYVLGKFFGIAAFLFLTAVLLCALSCAVITYVSIQYPPLLKIVWSNVVLSFLFMALKYILLVSCAFLLSTVSTSFFLPIFGSLAVFFAGSALQQVYDYLQSPSAQSYSPIIKSAVSGLYYILPNFSAFDLSVNAIYGIDLSRSGLLYTICYFAIYTTLTLACAAAVFSRREIQ